MSDGFMAEGHADGADGSVPATVCAAPGAGRREAAEVEGGGGRAGQSSGA